MLTDLGRNVTAIQSKMHLDGLTVSPAARIPLKTCPMISDCFFHAFVNVRTSSTKLSMSTSDQNEAEVEMPTFYSLREQQESDDNLLTKPS